MTKLLRPWRRGEVGDERLHPRARAFATAAGVYERARPGFPPAAVDWLCEHLGITSTTRVLDLAAGTGRLTRPLRERTPLLVAVEPMPEMREVLQAALPDVEVLDGTAERIPLASGSVGAVVVAQAFHWFEPEPALAEIARVLEPGGRLGLVWHTPDPSDPLQRAFRAIVERHRDGAPLHVAGAGAGYFEGQDGFREIAALDLRETYELDADALVALAESTSHVAALVGAERERALSDTRALVGPSGVVQLPYVIELSAYAATTSH
jgi:ubiquinone/menaquinone biosynthesis C-methylase UbiE